MVPVLGVDGSVKSIQKIFAEPGRNKWFMPGAEKKGGFCCIGSVGDKAYLCEGYATGASIYEATGTPVIVAFDGGNMKAVADELTAQGVPAASLVSVQGMGETSPVTGTECDGLKGNELVKCYAPDRRVEITVSGEVTTEVPAPAAE